MDRYGEEKAFPIASPIGGGMYNICHGMSLLDYFAAKALQGILAGDYELNRGSDDLNTATRAYQIGSAMLKVREGK